MKNKKLKALENIELEDWEEKSKAPLRYMFRRGALAFGIPFSFLVPLMLNFDYTVENILLSLAVSVPLGFVLGWTQFELNQWSYKKLKRENSASNGD